jgi:prevent-host-death family protein
MNSFRVSEDILSIGAFKARAAEVLRKLRERQQPIVITHHGKPAAVLLTPEEFDRLSEHDRFLAAVHEGLADSDAGRVVDDYTLTRELEAGFLAPEQP